MLFYAKSSCYLVLNVHCYIHIGQILYYTVGACRCIGRSAHTARLRHWHPSRTSVSSKTPRSPVVEHGQGRSGSKWLEVQNKALASGIVIIDGGCARHTRLDARHGCGSGPVRTCTCLEHSAMVALSFHLAFAPAQSKTNMEILNPHRDAPQRREGQRRAAEVLRLAVDPMVDPGATRRSGLLDTRSE